MFFLLPYGNDRLTFRFPAVTYTLIAANIAVFLWLLPVEHQAAMATFGLTPRTPSLLDILTSMFAHAGILHLLWNMLFLWLFGPNVEDALGRLEYAIFYLGSGVAAGLLHVLVAHSFMPQVMDVPVVGASGAIAGILGVFAIRFYKTKIKIFWFFAVLIYPIRWGTFGIPAVFGLGIWFLQQFFGGVFSIIYPGATGVAYWAHIGGMVFGAILAGVLGMGRQGSDEYLLADAMESMDKGTTWDAIENLKSLLERNPTDPALHSELAKVYAMEREADLALTHFQRCIDIHLSRSQRDKAVACYADFRHHFRRAHLSLKSEFQIARFLIEAQCYEPAVSLLENIAENHPDSTEAEVSLMKMAELLLLMGDLGRSVICCEDFLARYPHSSYRTMVEKTLASAQIRMP